MYVLAPRLRQVRQLDFVSKPKVHSSKHTYIYMSGTCATRKRFNQPFYSSTHTFSSLFSSAMPKLTFFSSKHFLVLSLALNVSLILRLIVHEGEEPHNHSCFGPQTTGASIARTNSNMLISSSSSSNSTTCTTGSGSRVINLDQ